MLIMPLCYWYVYSVDTLLSSQLRYCCGESLSLWVYHQHWCWRTSCVSRSYPESTWPRDCVLLCERCKGYRVLKRIKYELRWHRTCKNTSCPLSCTKSTMTGQSENFAGHTKWYKVQDLVYSNLWGIWNGETSSGRSTGYIHP